MTVQIPAWLETPPDNDPVPPPTISRSQTLPFLDLGWQDFERLVLRLVRRQENIKDCALYGTPGQAQEGIDILAVGANSEEVTCYQCKNVVEFGARDVRNAVVTFLEGKWAEEASTFVLCVASSLDSTQLQDEIFKLRQKLELQDITLVIWDGSAAGGLSELLKTLPELVDDFFGRGWVNSFNGEEAGASLRDRPDGNEMRKLRGRLYSLYDTVFHQHDPGLRIRGLGGINYIDRYVPVDVIEQTAIPSMHRVEQGRVERDTKQDQTIPSGGQQPEAVQPGPWLGIHEARRPTFEWLSGKQQCVVLGEPGSGKSALLRYLGLALLDTEASEIAALDEHVLRRLPVWISFARYSAMLKDQPNANVEDYIRSWLHQHSYSDIYPIFKRALEYSNVLLLVDGLDEGSSQTHRQEAFDRIIAFVLSTESAIFCTSRPRGFGQVGVPETWDTAVIAAMSDDQVKELATRWFSISELKEKREEDQDIITKQADIRAIQFLRSVKEHRRTGDLVRNPLLCQALVELYRFAHRLPEARMTIYEKIIDLLLSQHPAARAHAAYGVTPATLLGMKDQDLRELLIRIAIDLQTTTAPGLENAARCEMIASEFLEDDTDGLGLRKPEARQLAQDAIEQLISQYGLLVERGPGDIGFVHLSIQEYLAAEWHTRREEVAQLDWLEEVWLEPEWRECVTNWFAILGARGAKALTGKAVQRLSELGSVGEWQRLQSLELRTELACTDLGIPIREARKIVREATQSVETSSFRVHRNALARSITLGAIGSGVSDECATMLRRWVPGRPSYSRAPVLRCFRSWQPADDLLETLLRGLYDEHIHCRLAALDSLVNVFDTWPKLQSTFRDLALYDPRPEIRATGLRGLGTRPEWKDVAGEACAANLKSCSTDVLLTICALKVRWNEHTDEDLQVLWRMWLTGTVDYWNTEQFTDALCSGWPKHPGIRRAFTDILRQDGGSGGREIPLQYLLRCYPNDDDVAVAVADLFDRYGTHFALDMGSIWVNLIAHFRGHEELSSAVRRSLNAYKAKYKEIYWHPQISPGLIVIGDDDAREELLDAYLSVKPDMSRYWIAKTLMDGWPHDERVHSHFRHWASQNADAASPLASWASTLYPDTADRRAWLNNLVETASARSVTLAIDRLLDEFADEPSRLLVEKRLRDTDIWYYNRVGVEGSIARYFPSCLSSLDIVDRALKEIDGPQIADFASSYEHHPSLRSQILRAAVPATEDVRMTVASVLRDRPVNLETITRCLSHIFSEESGSVRTTALIARSRAIKHEEKDPQDFVDSLVNELESGGTYHQSRKCSALAALLELGYADKAVFTIAKDNGLVWHYYLPDALNNDTVSLEVIIDNWHIVKPLLLAANAEVDLPVGELINRGYASFLEKAELPREELDKYLNAPPEGTDCAHYFSAVAQRFPGSDFLKETLLKAFKEPNRRYDIHHRAQFVAARLLVEHFRNDEQVRERLTDSIEATVGGFNSLSSGVLGIITVGWPGGKCSHKLKSISEDHRQHWSAGNQLLVAVGLGDAEMAERVARGMAEEPWSDRPYRTEDIEALRVWSGNEVSLPVLRNWLKSNNNSLAITSLSIAPVDKLNKMLARDEMIERFNREMSRGGVVPCDGRDAANGLVKGWVNQAMTVL